MGGNRTPLSFSCIAQQNLPETEVSKVYSTRNEHEPVLEVSRIAQNKLMRSSVNAKLSPATFVAEAEATRKWHHLALVEEKILMQKSRIQWLALGDQNTTFYHQAVQDRAVRNNINVLYTESGEVLTEPLAIKKEAVDYFQRFLQAVPTRSSPTSVDALRSLLIYRCSPQDISLLISPISQTEIYLALKTMPNGKAPRPDGYTKEFFLEG